MTIIMNKKNFKIQNSLNFKIYQLALTLSRELISALREYDLTPEKWQVLCAVWQSSHPVNQTQISEITLKDKPSVSRLVSSMTQSGWLVRTPDKSDSRAYCVQPTPKALQKKEEIMDKLFRHFEVPMNQLGEKNQSELDRLVTLYIGYLNT